MLITSIIFPYDIGDQADAIIYFRLLARAEVEMEAKERAKAYFWAGNFDLTPDQV